MRTASTLIAVVLVVLIASPAIAHEDYEEVLMKLTAPDGKEFEVVRHWTDGIVVYDPAKLVLRRPNGEHLAETEYHRDILVTEISDGRWLAFAAEPRNLFYHRAWWIESGELVPADDFAHIPVAFAVAIKEHWVAYTINVSLIVAAFAAWRARNGQRIVWRRASFAALACFAIPIGMLVVLWWIEAVRAGWGADLMWPLAMTAIVAMCAYFCVRVCRTSGGTYGLATYLATFSMLLLTLYFSALPLSILLLAVLASLCLYLLIEKTPFAQVSPPSP